MALIVKMAWRGTSADSLENQRSSGRSQNASIPAWLLPATWAVNS